jgi:hypothetical protein
MQHIDLANIITDLALNKDEITNDNKIFEIVFKEWNRSLSYYANYILIRDLYLPSLEQLKANDDIHQNVYDVKINEIHAFFTLWFNSKNKQYSPEQSYPFVVSPGVIYEQSRSILDGHLLNDHTLQLNLVSANLLRQTIEILLLETCGYPLNANNRSPSFSYIVKTLEKNSIEVKFDIDEDYKKYINNITCLDLLKIFYDYLSGILHKNMSGFLFSWQLHFIQTIISGAFQQTFPRIDILDQKLTSKSKFYTNLNCTRGSNP